MNKKVIIIAIVIAVIIGITVGIVGTYSKSKEGSKIIGESNKVGEIKPSLENLSGKIVIDGSDSVYPITEKITEEFIKKYPNVSVNVGISGTGGGFKRFTIGETDINDSSRSITEQEIENAKQHGVRWIEIPIAIEGLSIIVNKDNNWIDCITIDQLRAIWRPDSKVSYWNDIDPRYPKEKITLYGPGPNHGTFDYFTEHVVGKAKQSRTDYIPADDYNVLVLGVSRDRFALGYVASAYTKNAQVKVLKVSSNGNCVEPNEKTIIERSYPLVRPLFIHVNYDKLNSKPELRRFVEFYLENVKYVAKDVGYQPLPEKYYNEAISVLRENRYNVDDKVTFNKLYESLR